MTLQPETIRWVAKLAYLNLTESEEGIWAENLGSILEYVGELSEVDTDKVSEIRQITGLTNQLAPDVVSRWEDTDALIENAPHREGRFIKVKKVL